MKRIGQFLLLPFVFVFGVFTVSSVTLMIIFAYIWAYFTGLYNTLEENNNETEVL